MSEYTPTTEDVRNAWVGYRLDVANSLVIATEFDRWLAAHDAAVRADQIEKDAAHILVVAAETAKAQRESDLSEGIKPIGTSTPLEAEWYQYGNWAGTTIRAQLNHEGTNDE